MSRILIAGGPGCGKSTLAAEEASRLGLKFHQCTDTWAQAERTGRASRESVLYAPSKFDHDWSGLSQWVADNWLTKPGPWVIEGVAVARALRKWKAWRVMSETPCDRLVWITEPRMHLTSKQEAMLKAHDSIMTEVLEDWPELREVLVLE